ncbi:MAG: polysaccharide lyase 6 family protein [Opitutaceae bacterium]|nr:polysaccharide lyase 6 family protein [Opitutaceae bacterium]
MITLAILRRLRAFVLFPLAVAAAAAANQTVDSLAALQAAINTAVPGDTITVKNGAYTTGAYIAVRRAGTVENPIIITAETVGGVEINGTHGFNVSGAAAHIVIAGFRFVHSSGRCTIAAGTSNVRFTRNVFQCAGDGVYLSVSGDDAQIDHNEFADKRTTGPMLALAGTGTQVARRAWIHRNHFRDFAPTQGASTTEALRFGLSNLARSIGAGIVEHNLFERCNGGTEFIANKSSGNIYRYNTMLDSPAAHFGLRHGNDCLVYGNTMIRTEGLWIFGDRHRIHSNRFEKNFIGVNLGNGSGDQPDGGSTSGQDRPDDCVIVFNTFIENRTHYQMSRRMPPALGANNTVFANNLIVGGGTASRIDGPNTGAVWAGNVIWQTGGAGSLPTGSYISADPLLEADAAGLLRPQAGSPVIDAAKGDYPTITVDFEGQTREGAKDIGADEVSTAPVAARLLKPADVGPLAK